MGGFVGINSGQSPGGMVDQSFGGVVRDAMVLNFLGLLGFDFCVVEFLEDSSERNDCCVYFICVLMLVVCCLGWLS